MPVPPSDGGAPTAGPGSVAQRLRYVVLVALPLAAVLILLWFTYTRYQAARDRYLTESYLRALGAVAEQTEGAINGLSGAVDQAIREWERQAGAVPTAWAGPPANPCVLNDAIADLLDLSGLRINGDAARRADPPRVIAAPHIPPHRQSRPRNDRSTSTMRAEPIDSAGSDLLLCRRVPWAVRDVAGFRGCGGAVDNSHLCAERKLGAIVRARLLGSDIEGLDVFLVDERGAVLFESGHSGLRYLALRPARDKADAKAADGKPAAPAAGTTLPGPDEIGAATVVRTVDIDGTPHRFFSHPLRLETGSAQHRNWAIATVVRSDRMEAESRVPILVLAGIPGVLILAALALPFLKLATMGRRDPFPPTTAVGIGVALLLGGLSLTSGALAWMAAGQLRTAYDRELNRFARALQRNFAAELDAAYAGLIQFRDLRAAGRSLAETDTEYLSCWQPKGGGTTCRRQASRDAPGEEVPDVAALANRLSSYPWWKFLVLVGSDGWQREKWTRHKVNTAVLDMTDDSAFADVVKHRLLPLGGDPTRPYALNVMTSPNTGNVLSILSAPIPAPAAGVAMMVTDFASVSDPIVAPDMGFAIITRSGQVIFHYSDRLRLYENLFTEVSDAESLRAAVFAGRGGFFDLEYHGQPRRMLLRPLPDSDWSLVVFRDRDALRMLMVQVMLVATLLGGVLVVGYLLWLFAARLLLGRDLLTALWPNPRAVVRYRLLRALLAVLPIWSVLILRTADPVGHMLGVILAAAIAFTATLLILTLGQADSPRRWMAGAFVLMGLMAAATFLSVALLEPWAVGLWIGIAGTLCLAVGGWEPSWIPDTRGDRAVTIRLHRAVTALLLVNLTVLPATAIVSDAVAAGNLGLTRARQLVLAERTAAKRREEGGADDRDAARRKWTAAGFDAFRSAAPLPAAQAVRPVGSHLLSWAEALGLCRDDHGPPPLCHFGGHVPGRRDDSARRRCELLRRHPTAPIVAGLALSVFLEESRERRYTTYAEASDCAWIEDRSGQHTLVDGAAVNAGAPQIVRLPNWDIGLRIPDGPWPLLLLAAGLAVVGWIAWLLLGWVLGRVFCVEAWDGATPNPGVDAAGGRYYLRPAPATLARLRQAASAGACIDLDACPRPRDVEARRATIHAGPVLVLHWEHGAADAAWRLATLALLEELVLRRGLSVDLTSEIDILTHVAEADADGGTAAELVRWARVLEQLDKQRDDLPAAPLPPRTGQPALLFDECRWTPRLLGIRAAILADLRWTALSPEALLRHIGDLAEAHYRCLWAKLTQEERLLLCHLSADGFVNPRGAGMARDLLRRGLIRRAPALRVMNESFRQFVLGVEDRATIRAWERAGGTSPWAWLRNGVLAVVVVGGVLLFVTQPESYTRWVGLLGALTTIGGGTANLLGLFQTKRAAAG